MDIDSCTPFITELEQDANSTAIIKKKLLTPPSAKIAKSRKHRPLSYNNPQLSTSKPCSTTKKSTFLEWAAFFFHMTRVSVTWLHYALQLLLVSTAIYSLLSLALSFRSDLHSKARAHRIILLQKREECARNYKTNKCWPLESRLPALQEKCEEWGEAMRMDVESALPWSRLIARTLAETVEGFIEGVSWRTLAFCLSLLAVYLLTGMQRSPQSPVIRIVQDTNRASSQITNNSNPFLLLTDK